MIPMPVAAWILMQLVVIKKVTPKSYVFSEYQTEAFIHIPLSDSVHLRKQWWFTLLDIFI